MAEAAAERAEQVTALRLRVNTYRTTFAHSIPGHHRPMGRPHLTWMDTAMHDMGSLGCTLQIDLPRDWANLALYRDVWRGVVSRC